jgi:hypothetical protein
LHEIAWTIERIASFAAALRVQDARIVCCHNQSLYDFRNYCILRLWALLTLTGINQPDRIVELNSARG